MSIDKPSDLLVSADEWCVMPGGIPIAQNRPGHIKFLVCDANGEPREVVRFEPDGSIVVAPESSADDAARGFWACVERLRPANWPSPRHADAIAALRDKMAMLAKLGREEAEDDAMNTVIWVGETASEAVAAFDYTMRPDAQK